ncbi:hypothetical protein N7540_000200 [Penicillium herquei]|nr:hypothetical protein N7540_000200 [Penicillium herquei]
MRLLSSLLAIYFCGISVQASSWSQSIDSRPTPHADKRLQVNLNEITGFSLQAGGFTIDHVPVERIKPGFCDRVPFGTETCRSIQDYLISCLKATISAIRDLSGNDSCNSMRGTYESLTWFYHSSGRECNRDSQREFIIRGIEEYLKDTDIDKFRGVECITVDKGGGPMEGFLKLGPTAIFPSNPYCDSHSEL